MVQPSHARLQSNASTLLQLSTSKSADEFQTSDEHSVSAVPAHHSTLPFHALSTDGGQYSPQHACEQLFKDDKSCYSSKPSYKHGINVVGKHSGLCYCTIELVTFRVPTEGYSCPAAQAIIFTSWDEPDLTGLEAFDNVHSQQDFDAASEAWCRKKSKETGVQTAFSKPMPVAFLDTRHHHKASISPKVPRSGKYVVLKLLRPCHPGDNIDAEFVGLHGWSGRKCHPCRLPVPL